MVIKWKTHKKYHTVGTVQKYHTVGTVQKYHTVGTVQKYHTVGTVPKSNRKSQKETKSISLTQKHDYSLSWLGTGTVKSGGVKRVLLARRALPF